MLLETVLRVAPSLLIPRDEKNPHEVTGILTNAYGDISFLSRVPSWR
jgi:hypothetical protein